MEAIDGGVTGSAGATESACTRGGVRCSCGSRDGQVSLFSGADLFRGAVMTAAKVLRDVRFRSLLVECS